MSADNTIPTPATTDPNGTVQPVGTVPSATATPTPATAGAQPSDNSNRPDASTPAANSIPAAMINNPAVPTQKLAAQADANKNSPAPAHSMLYTAAREMVGNPMKTTVAPDGTVTHTPAEVKPWALGLALALNVLQGGLQGVGAKNVGDAARAGAQVAEQQRARVQQANANQDAQAIGDQKNKMAVTEGNMRLHLLAQQVGASDKAVSQVLPDAYKSLTDGLMDGSTPMTNGASMDKPVFETDAAAAVKNGQTNITHDAMFPVGDALPVMENGQQKFVNGQALYGHNYIVVHNADKLQATLTDDLKKKLQSIGYFRNADGTTADIGNPQWSFADLSQKMSQYAAIQTGEAMLNQHLNDAHDYLGTDEKDIPKLKDLTTEVRTDPNMRKAIQTFSRFGGTAPIDVILSNMNQVDPQSAAKIMNYLHLTPKQLGQMADARAKEAAEAKTVKSNSAELDAQKRQDLLLKDPITATNADSVIAAHNKPTAGVVIPEDRYQQAVAFNDQQVTQKGKLSGAEAKGKTDAEAKSGDIQELAQNIVVGGDLAKIGDVTSMRGGQKEPPWRTRCMMQQLPLARIQTITVLRLLRRKPRCTRDYREGKTSNNVQAFDAFLGHANDAMDANDAWRRSSSPLINKPLNWFAAQELVGRSELRGIHHRARTCPQRVHVILERQPRRARVRHQDHGDCAEQRQIRQPRLKRL